MNMASEQDRLWVGSMPEAYNRWLAPAVFRPFAHDLARRAERLAPGRILEIAAGTGVLTNELVTALPMAEVTATDLNAAMVEFGHARRRARNGGRPMHLICLSTTTGSTWSPASSV